MRGSYSGNTLAFQANAESSILLPRSTTTREDIMAKPQKQDASALSKTLAGQWSKSEKRAVASRSIMDASLGSCFGTR